MCDVCIHRGASIFSILIEVRLKDSRIFTPPSPLSGEREIVKETPRVATLVLDPGPHVWYVYSLS